MEPRNLQPWNTINDVVTSIDQYVNLDMRASHIVTSALTIAKDRYGSKCIAPGTQRTHIVQAVRRIQVLVAGLDNDNAYVLAAAAVMHLRRLRLHLDEISSAAMASPPEVLYEMIGGTKTMRIADTASMFSGTPMLLQRGTPEYQTGLDTLRGDYEALLVVLAENYVYGGLFYLMDQGLSSAIYQQTKYDLLPLAEGTPHVDGLFGPWLDLYAHVENP